MKKSTFIVNKDCHFFECLEPIDAQLLTAKECSVFETKQEMYAHLCKTLNLELCEVENAEIVIENGYATCSMGYQEEILDTVEDFIINYEL